MKLRKTLSVFLGVLILISNLVIVSTADELPDSLVNNFQSSQNDSVQPLYDIIHSVSLGLVDNGVEAIIETDTATSLQITVTIYQQKGSSWSMAVKKSFSDYNTILGAIVEHDFQPGEVYKVVANFRAGGERETMEDIYGF